VRNEKECVRSAPNCCDTEQRSASNILISGKIIKEKPCSVASGTHCIYCTIMLVCFRVTKEHRENLAKNAKALFIKCRDSIRDVQNKYVKTVKSNSTISQDLSHNIQDQVSHICVNRTRSAKNNGVELLKEIHTFLGAHTENQLFR